MAFVTQMEFGRKMSSMWRISLLDTLETFFTHKDQQIHLLLLKPLNPVVTSDMNDSLTQVFQADEVHRALKQMYPKKSSKPDGMPPFFY